MQDDIFADLESGLNLESDNDLNLSEYQDLVEDEEVTLRVQPAFFENEQINVESLMNPTYWSMPDNEETTIGTVHSSSGNYQGFVTRSNEYCFLKLTKNNVDHKFFFKCEALVEGYVYFRILNDECPYPMINPPSPPTEEVCFLYAKRASDNVKKIVETVGELSEGVLECYIKVIETVQPGNLESQCTREAISSEWKAITAQDLKKLSEENVTTYTDEKGITHYEFKAETNQTIIEAK